VLLIVSFLIVNFVLIWLKKSNQAMIGTKKMQKTEAYWVFVSSHAICFHRTPWPMRGCLTPLVREPTRGRFAAAAAGLDLDSPPPPALI
jgi:hypothetical protein